MQRLYSILIGVLLSMSVLAQVEQPQASQQPLTPSSVPASTSDVIEPPAVVVDVPAIESVEVDTDVVDTDVQPEANSSSPFEQPRAPYIRRPTALPTRGTSSQPLQNNNESLLPDQRFTLWSLDTSKVPQLAEQDPVIIDEPVTETVRAEQQLEAIQFRPGGADIPPAFLTNLRDIIDQLGGRDNVQLRFIGHSDDDPLSPALRARYTSNLGLSRARAQIVADYFRQALQLPLDAVSIEGRGSEEPVASNQTAAGKAQNRRVEVEVYYDVERDSDATQNLVQPVQKAVKICRVEERCIYRRRVGKFERIQVRNALPPIRYDGSRIRLPRGYIDQVREVLEQYREQPNLQIRVVGHTDNTALQGQTAQLYEGTQQLSQAVARRIAQELKDELNLTNREISFVGVAATRPLADNNTVSGRTLNRRVDVEVWHDDAQGLSVTGPLACPGDGDAEMVTVLYEDDIPQVSFREGQPDYPGDLEQRIQRALIALSDKTNVRINFVGHTTNETLSRREATVYGDHVGLSRARAARVLRYVEQNIAIGNATLLSEGRGFVDPIGEADTSSFARKNFSIFTQSEASSVDPRNARVELEFLYDELAALRDDPNLEIIPVMVDEPPITPYTLHPIRVTVDGETLDDTRRHGADVQRCTDVALDNANIQFQYDNLDDNKALNVSAYPPAVARTDDPETPREENLLQFRGYSNYPSFISRGEVRIFDWQQSEKTEPLLIVPLNDELQAEWSVLPGVLSDEVGPVNRLKYLLRVYDQDERFDETDLKPLWVLYESDAELPAADAESFEQLREQRIGYGENSLRIDRIRVRGGKITTFGQQVPEGHTVWVMDQAVPLNEQGEFVNAQIIPDGLHSVEVAVIDDEGNGQLYYRDLKFANTDWYHVGIADLTLGIDDTDGPASLVTQDEQHYESDFWADGQISFYSKGKTRNGYTITASADTREEPIEDLFSNALDKTPDAFFRRLDPDYYYPTYGDDSTVIEDAPTSGKFFLKAEKNESFAMWGNFEASITDTDLAQIDRTLYGALGHYESTNITKLGETKTRLDLFVAEPGTLAAREEFRGTGGSLYFLGRRDLNLGSERLRIEVRDKDSDIVLSVLNLIPEQDYDIDYIQGRILLTRPLSSTAADGDLVRDDSISGNPVFLVVRYEFTPGFDDIDDTVNGLRASHWLGDHVKLGMTYNQQDILSEEQTLAGIDLTIAKTLGTYIKLESAQSEGEGVSEQFSFDGGFGFQNRQNFGLDGSLIGPAIDDDDEANAYRIEGASDFADLWQGGVGRASFYYQEREAGFSAPGQLSRSDITQTGAAIEAPLNQVVSIDVSVDSRDQENLVLNEAAEADVNFQITPKWQLSTGVRYDNREDQTAASSFTRTDGERTDAAVQLSYDALTTWSAYTYVQNTLETTETRDNNNRVGVGGTVQVTDRATVNAEASEGSSGFGGLLGFDYLVTDRTNIYINYALENERTDNGFRGRNGSTAAGFRTRFSDATTVYGEERYAFGDIPSGLTHVYGIDMAASDRWNLGFSIEAGSLEDNFTGFEIDRMAYGGSAAYGSDTITFGLGLEWREDETDASSRETWLIRTNSTIKVNPSWRLLTKLNMSDSNSSLGDFYDGDYTEAVLGFAYRPIDNDRLNMLAKVTYFENLPSTFDEVSNGSRGQVLQRTDEFVQESTIYSIDATYDLTRRWSIGAKYGFRNGRVALDAQDPDFFESDAHLIIARVDWHVVHRWDWLIEARQLEVVQAEDKRQGFLTGIYRHFGEHVKAGVGYNFTDFSDDLTDLDFDSQGAFINVIGKW